MGTHPRDRIPAAIEALAEDAQYWAAVAGCAE